MFQAVRLVNVLIRSKHALTHTELARGWSLITGQSVIPMDNSNGHVVVVAGCFSNKESFGIRWPPVYFE